jgi:hypothetical protein
MTGTRQTDWPTTPRLSEIPPEEWKCLACQ